MDKDIKKIQRDTTELRIKLEKLYKAKVELYESLARLHDKIKNIRFNNCDNSKRN